MFLNSNSLNCYLNINREIFNGKSKSTDNHPLVSDRSAIYFDAKGKRAEPRDYGRRKGGRVPTRISKMIFAIVTQLEMVRNSPEPFRERVCRSIRTLVTAPLRLGVSTEYVNRGKTEAQTETDIVWFGDVLV